MYDITSIEFLLRSLFRPLSNIAPLTPVVLNPERASRSVDFPAPDGPIMAISWLPGNFPLTL